MLLLMTISLLHDYRAWRPVITFEAALNELYDMEVHGFNRIGDRCQWHKNVAGGRSTSNPTTLISCGTLRPFQNKVVTKVEAET